MIPTIGRIVHYRLNEQDVADILLNRSRPRAHVRANHVSVGDVLPALIVRAWGAGEGSAVNLQGYLDGEDCHWVTSRCEGEAEGTWFVPPRV